MDISKLLTYLPQLYNNVLCGDRKSIISRIYGSISNIHLSVVKPSGLSYVDLFSFEQKERRESLAMQIVCKETKIIMVLSVKIIFPGSFDRVANLLVIL